MDSLAPLLADGVVDEVVGRLKSGKEAELWLVRRAGELLAAKVYKARQVRSFRHRAAYQEGRQVRNTRTRRAMERGSGFGRASEEEAWKAKEADALHALHARGVRVPRPALFYEGVLLMELVVDAAGNPAPRLVDARVARDEAAALYADLRGQAVRMLACDLIHGDLSPYNVLLGHHGPVVIDFPQVIGAAHNSQAERFFRRDLENLRRFLAAIDPALHRAAGDAAEIWRAYVRRELTPDFVPSGRAPEEKRAAHGHREGRTRQAQGAHPQGPRAQGAHARGAPADDQRRTQPRGGQPRFRGSPPAPERPARRRGDRSRGPAGGPEVVRVVRPVLGPHGGTAHPPAPAATLGPAASPAGVPPAGPGRRRRRRRRRG